MTLHHFDLRGRVRVQLLTYVGGKFPLFCSLRTHYETSSLLKKICLYASGRGLGTSLTNRGQGLWREKSFVSALFFDY